MRLLLSDPVLVSPVLVELLAPAGRVAAEVAHQALLLVHGVDVVLQVGQVVTPVLTVAALEDRLARMTRQEMFPSQ